MANPNVILQWNCDGLQGKRNEIELLISKHSPAIICLQETKLNPEIEILQNENKPLPSYVNFKGYKGYFKCIDSGCNGIATYIRNGIFHHHLKCLKTKLQALAVSVTFQGKQFVVSNHYVSNKHDKVPTKGQYNYIVNQFNQPYIMCGDFNAHNVMWSGHSNNKRGDELEDFMAVNDLGLLNSEVKTHYNKTARKWSLLDLSIIHPALYLDFECEILSDLHGSDHTPIIVTYNGEIHDTDKNRRWNFKRANWSSFQVQCEKELNNLDFIDQDDSIELFTQKLLKIAENNIPLTSPFHGKCSKPWFDDECKAVKRERNKANRLNRRYPCLSNHIKVKVANARAKRTFKRKKKESWKNYVSSINSRTPTKKIWNMIAKITGKNIPGHLLHIKDSSSGEYITNKEDIANKIGETFKKNSSSENYTEEFRNIKKREEENPIDFTTNKDLTYNKKFRLRDLKRSIKKSKDTSPGPDGIHYRILKNLPDSILKVLLDLINKHWMNQTFPKSWREAVLLPIPKPGKDPQNPDNFRPIALTSCICKTVERMVNERLIYYLEKNNILSRFQAGFRRDRSTIDQLVRLDTYIKDAFINKDHVVGVFFDLAKAYDTTWRYGILKDLYKLGLRGNLPIFIQNFLTERTFQILLCTTLSDRFFPQEEGVPQGAILSTTLFNVKLNDIAKELSDGIECSLYVDDFVIFFRSKTIETIERKLQININKIIKWTAKNGFSVSSNKTVAIHFCDCKDPSCPDPVLKLGDNEIRFVNEHKFLGLIWDKELTFHAHIQNLLKKCRKSLNIIKILSYSNWGSDTKTLLKLFRTLIRSKIDYGSIVYRSAKDKKDLEALNVLHRQGIRLCLGAFKSSPNEALYVEANEPPLRFRREELAMRYALKIKSNPDNPTNDSIFNLNHSEKYENEDKDLLPLGESLHRLFEEAHINTDEIAITKLPDVPIWRSEINEVNFKLASYDKSTTSPFFFQTKFMSEIITEYPDYLHIYTDGSKQDNLAAYGVHCNYGNLSNRLTDDTSIFSAEIAAIHSSLKYIRISPRANRKFVIFCDSKSVLECIDNQESRNPLMVGILDSLQKLKFDGFVIKFCWIPSHVGIRGNESADQQAKSALQYNYALNSKIPHSDLIPKVKQYIKQKWQNHYEQSHLHKRTIKLYSIAPVIKPFYINGLNRRDEQIIHRLRIGHTRLTHRYLMEDPFQRVPPCNFCYLDTLSVSHIMIECQHFARIRSRYYTATSLRELFERYSLKHILEFVKRAGLYNLL